MRTAFVLQVLVLNKSKEEIKNFDHNDVEETLMGLQK